MAPRKKVLSSLLHPSQNALSRGDEDLQALRGSVKVFRVACKRGEGRGTLDSHSFGAALFSTLPLSMQRRKKFASLFEKWRAAKKDPLTFFFSCFSCSTESAPPPLESEPNKRKKTHDAPPLGPPQAWPQHKPPAQPASVRRRERETSSLERISISIPPPAAFESKSFEFALAVTCCASARFFAGWAQRRGGNHVSRDLDAEKITTHSGEVESGFASFFSARRRKGRRRCRPPSDRPLLLSGARV